MQKPQLKNYRIEVNHWTWIGVICAVIFSVILVMEVMDTTETEETNLPVDHEMSYYEPFDDPIEMRLGSLKPTVETMSGSTPPISQKEDDTIIEMSPPGALENILELISRILDRIVQIIAGLTALFSIYKSIKRKDS